MSLRNTIHTKSGAVVALTVDGDGVILRLSSPLDGVERVTPMTIWEWSSLVKPERTVGEAKSAITNLGTIA